MCNLHFILLYNIVSSVAMKKYKFDEVMAVNILYLYLDAFRRNYGDHPTHTDSFNILAQLESV